MEGNLSINSSAVRRLLISIESPNDYLISAVAPFRGGYLVPRGGDATFSICSTLTFHGEVYLISFATTTARHTPTGSVTATPTATMSDQFTLVWAPCQARRIMRFSLFLFLAAHADAA
jgi:hypothetical protein